MNNIKIILENIVKSKNFEKRKPKYCISYYINYIMLILNDVTSWSSLGNIMNTIQKGTKKYHYKTIYNVYIKWCKLGIFKELYDTVGDLKLNYNSHSTIDLYIDTTIINNKNGSEDISYSMNKKKKTSKISLICNDNKVPVLVFCHQQ